MRNLLKASIAAGALVLAAPALAQYTFAQPGQPQVQPVEVWNNVARVNLGVGFYNSGWYDCYYYYYPGYSCTSGSYTSYIPFLVGPQVDFNLGGVNNISVGFDVLLGTVSYTAYAGTVGTTKSVSATIWEPTIDYVAKLGPATQDTVGRLRVGGGMYIGPTRSCSQSTGTCTSGSGSGIGGTFRIGGGASFLNAKRIGIGLDLVLEGGSYQGYWIGGLQLMASPEFHF